MLQQRDVIFLLTVALACAVGFYILKPPTLQKQAPADVKNELLLSDMALPDFSRYNQVSEKKSAFFDFMLPLIKQENQRITEDREKLIALKQADGLNEEQLQWLSVLLKKYRLNREQKDNNQLLDELLLRVDLVPPSLALAQSANESAWGTSRFAVEGNNLFGQWCFSEGCGLVPTSRPDGAAYEVAVFPSPVDSVESYILNLNTNLAYQGFRKIRAQQRQQTDVLSGETSAMGLLKYSSRGEEYVQEIQAMIRVNNLDQYDSI